MIDPAEEIESAALAYARQDWSYIGIDINLTLEIIMKFTKIIASIIFSSMPLVSLASTPVENADMAMQIFFDSCAKNYGNNSASSKWAQSHLTRASQDFESKVLRGQSGEVWGAAGNFLLVLTNNSCAVWSRRADAKKTNANVEKLVKKIARPGIDVKNFIDKISEGHGGKYRQYGFQLVAPNKKQGMVILSTTSESPTAEIQARITLSPVKL